MDSGEQRSATPGTKTRLIVQAKRHTHTTVTNAETRNRDETSRTSEMGGTMNETGGTSDTNVRGRCETSAGCRRRRRVVHTTSPILQSTNQNTDDSTVFGNATTPFDRHVTV